MCGRTNPKQNKGQYFTKRYAFGASLQIINHKPCPKIGTQRPHNLGWPNLIDQHQIVDSKKEKAHVHHQSGQSIKSSDNIGGTGNHIIGGRVSSEIREKAWERVGFCWRKAVGTPFLTDRERELLPSEAGRQQEHFRGRERRGFSDNVN